MIEVINECPTKMSKAIPLKDFPRKLKNPITDDCDLHLLGIISYKGPSEISSGLAHYTALCFVDGTWYQFDDLHATATRKSAKQKIVPEVLVYTTVNSEV